MRQNFPQAAALVLQALNEKWVETAIEQRARQKKASDLTAHLGQSEKAIRLGH